MRGIAGSHGSRELVESYILISREKESLGLLWAFETLMPNLSDTTLLPTRPHLLIFLKLSEFPLDGD